jgi:hypothetical protein
MSLSDPSQSLDKDFARAVPLVRTARTRLLPTGWSDWRGGLPPPAHKLDVDQLLDQIAAGRTRLLSASEVRDRHSITSIKSWPSHQTALRYQLSWYAEVEFQDSITYAATEAPVARRRLKLLNDAEEPIADYCRLTPMDRELQIAFQKAKATALENLYAIRPPEGGKPAQRWKAWFVIRLGGFWCIITGEQPSSSSDGNFVDLVSAAWSSFHPDLSEINWDSFVDAYASSANLEDGLETAFISSAYANRFWRS